MGNGFPYDVLLLAAIAVFCVLRLRNALGKRTGHEEPPKYDPFKQDQGDDKVVHLPNRSQGDRSRTDDIEDVVPDIEATDQTWDRSDEQISDEPGSIEPGLRAIKQADRDFDPKQFAGGAASAFEMIIGAFAQGDTEALRPLLANDVYNDFSGAIANREEQNQSLETTLIGIESSEIIEAELQGRTAFVTIKFVSEQVNVTRDENGETVEGDPNHVTKITDIWTFARNTASRDPNWALVATRSPN
ncbi:Tim44/TimA family putative adaptor protein [Pelagibius sp. Alg239-R121]|uniref:Tim44/TimA family putative adaptor protein n=1 Tax=Pelagibius sp. Alg239-R121 TaxID=2993448 RepID=UPI0024A6A605|nr:Tim44/TimA family putative adaptor protein [Pelagibius sp. Alg239-R121]